MWNVKTRVITSCNRSNWRHHRRIQKISGQQIGKARYQGTAKKQPYPALSTCTSEITYVKVQNIHRAKTLHVT